MLTLVCRIRLIRGATSKDICGHWDWEKRCLEGLAGYFMLCWNAADEVN